MKSTPSMKASENPKEHSVVDAIIAGTLAVIAIPVVLLWALASAGKR